MADEVNRMKQNPDPAGEGSEPGADLAEAVQEYSNEYINLNDTLDMIDSCLSGLEQRNDDLTTKLQALLQSNRAVREEMERERSTEPPETSSGEDKESKN